MKNDLIWAYMLKLSHHMWDDETSPARGWYLKPQYTETNNTDIAVWDETVKYCAECGFNLILVDVGDGVRYESHPEISAPDAWDKDFLKKKLDEMRALGIEPIPKLNFSTGHDTWLKKYRRMISTDIYYAVCADLKIRKCPKKQFNLSQIRADKPERILEVNSNESIRLFTNRGAMLNLRVSDIPETRASARAANLVSIVELEKGETIVGAFPDRDEGSYLFCTTGGMVKRSNAADYRVRGKRTAALNLKDKDVLLGAYPMPTMDILLVTEQGMCIRFAADSVPETGRAAAGVIGIKLEPKDRVCACMPVGDEGELIVLSDRGFGKRSFLFDYEQQGRNGKGVKTFDFRKNGSNGTRIAYAGTVQAPFTLIVEQRHGTKTPIDTEQIHIEPKASKGEMLLAVVLDDDVVGAYRSDE